MWIRWAVTLCALTIACDLTSPDRRCQPLGEFANDGCADIEGEVRHPDGTPIQGAQVVVFERFQPGFGTNTVPTSTNDRGRFSLRITCIQGCPADTVRYWIHASANGVVDSVASTLAFVGVGQAPEPRIVLITLGRP